MVCSQDTSIVISSFLVDFRGRGVEDRRPTIETWMTVDPPCMAAVSGKV